MTVWPSMDSCLQNRRRPLDDILSGAGMLAVLIAAAGAYVRAAGHRCLSPHFRCRTENPHAETRGEYMYVEDTHVRAKYDCLLT